MIGTSYEMLLLLSYDSDIMTLLKYDKNRIRDLRHRLSSHDLSEDYIIELLERVGCRCIRPCVVLPCIVKDKNGRLFDEYTFVKMFFTPELAKKYGVDYDKVKTIANHNHSINRPLFKHLLKSRRAWIVLDKMLLDSIWSYEPIELTFTPEKIQQIRGMIASSIPVSDKPYDVLTFEREHPVTWSPDQLPPIE